jgi:hypothetical protein
MTTLSSGISHTQRLEVPPTMLSLRLNHMCFADCRLLGNWPETGLGEIDLLEADASLRVRPPA